MATTDTGRRAARDVAGPRRAALRAGHVRRQGSGHDVPADRGAAPAGGRAQRAGRADRRRRLRLVERVRRAVRDAERRAARGGGPEVQPLPHDGAVLADAGGAAERPQPPHVGMGGITEIATARAGLQLDAPEHVRAARGDPQAQRLLDRPVRQVPRGAGLADQPAGAVRQLADRQRLRVLLRVHRRRGPPVLPGALRGHDPGRARPHARGGLPPHGRHDRQGDQLGPPAEGADAGQALLRVLRPRRHPRAAPRPEGVGRQVQGALRRRLGRAPRAHLRAPEGTGRDPAGRPSSRRAMPRSRPGTRCPRRSSRCCAARWRSTRASWSSPTTTSAGCSTRSTTSRCSTTRSSSTSSATTGRRPRARSTAPSTR